MAKTSAFLTPQTPSAALAVIVGTKPLPRHEVSMKVWGYIKKHGLQDPINRRIIRADEALKPIFGGKRLVSMFEMTKLLTVHLTPAKPPRERRAKAVECCPTCNRPLD